MRGIARLGEDGGGMATSARPLAAGTGLMPDERLPRSLQRIADAVTTQRDVRRVAAAIAESVAELVHPTRHALLLADQVDRRPRFARGGSAGRGGPRWPCAVSPEAGPTGWRGTEGSIPLHATVDGTPIPRRLREACRRTMDGCRVEVLIPIGGRDRLAGLLALGPRRCGRPYTAGDLRLLGVLASHSAVALEQVKTRRALGAAQRELEAVRRRVDDLEGMRAHLAKFVPETVRALIERAPAAPALAQREADVTVLFVDIVGYARLSERLDPKRANYLVERYFGAFLDEVLARGGDVNETTGDGLMIIFEHAERRVHARAAVEAAVGIIRRTQAINAELGEGFDPIALHVGVNSGIATLGVRRLEGRAGARWTYTASGSLSNVAARLAELGTGDAVMVGPTTRARLRHEFAFEPIGRIRLRNMERPIRVARLPVSGPTATPAPRPMATAGLPTGDHPSGAGREA